MQEASKMADLYDEALRASLQQDHRHVEHVRRRLEWRDAGHWALEVEVE